MSKQHDEPLEEVAAEALRPHALAFAATPLFAGLSSRLLQQIGDRAVERQLARGEVVFQRGDQGNALYLVRSGLLKVYDSAADGSELVLTTVPPGATVGELALADGGTRSASLAALRESRVLVLGREDFLHALRTDGALAEPLLRHLATHLRRATDLAADLVFLDLSARIAKLLTRLADEAGHPAGPGHVLSSMTQSDLASMVGASRQSTNGVLRGFLQSGWLELEGRQIRLLRPDMLREHADQPT